VEKCLWLGCTVITCQLEELSKISKCKRSNYLSGNNRKIVSFLSVLFFFFTHPIGHTHIVLFIENIYTSIIIRAFLIVSQANTVGGAELICLLAWCYKINQTATVSIRKRNLTWKSLCHPIKSGHGGSKGFRSSFRYILSWKELWIKLVMGPVQNFLTRVGSGQPFMVWVRIWKISPKNVKIFNFFPFRVKKIASGRVRKNPGQSRVGLLFTMGQK